MDGSTLLQTLLFGVFVGSIYGMAAVGLSLVFGVLNVLNTAHGELLMLGGYVSFWLFALLGLDPFVSLLICRPLLFAVRPPPPAGPLPHVPPLDHAWKNKNFLLI